MAIAYFCPSCWSEIGQASNCPSCGADLHHFADESYEQKLIRALRHPEPTVPIRAATVLGLLRSRAAVEPLIEVAFSTTDPYIQETAIAALGSIGDPRALPLLTRLSREGALRVRTAAQRAAAALESTTHASER